MTKEIIPIERIAQSIRWIRGHKVLLDSDLAVLYGVTTKGVESGGEAQSGAFPTILCSSFDAGKSQI